MPTNEYLLMTGEREFPSASLSGFLRRSGDRGTWEGHLGSGELTEVVFEAEQLSFVLHFMGHIPTKHVLQKVGELDLYRQARFHSYAMGDGINRTFNWSEQNDNMTLLVIPVAEGFTRHFFRKLPKPIEKPLDEAQVVNVPW